MKNKRVKLIESSDSESPVPLNEIKRKKKRVAGVDDATLRRTEKVVNLSKKLAGFSKSLDESIGFDHEKIIKNDQDSLFDIPKVNNYSTFKFSTQIEEIDLYKEYITKIMNERNRAKGNFLQELEKIWKKEGKV